MVVASDLTVNQRGMTGDAQALRQIFDSVDAASCPHTYNFHMHTVCSDGKLTPSALMEQVVAIGLQGFAITDHHTLAGYHQAQNWLEDWRWRHPTPIHRRQRSQAGVGTAPRLFTGVEITALLAGTEVHVLGYGFAPHHGAMAPYLQGHAPEVSSRRPRRSSTRSKSPEAWRFWPIQLAIVSPPRCSLTQRWISVSTV